MNVAFSTLLILVLISPGFIARYAFLKGPYSRKYFSPSITDEIFWSIIPAFFIQVAGYVIVSLFTNKVSLKNIYLLVIGSDKVNLYVVNEGIFPFFSYSFIIIIISFLLGWFARWAVIHFRLDLKYNILKVNNEWYYLFSGKIADQEVDLIQLDALVKSEKGTMLYSGILEDYFLNKEGGIDRLYLIKVHRDRKYQMPGDYFVIFGKEILNMNLTFFRLTDNENK